MLQCGKQNPVLVHCERKFFFPCETSSIPRLVLLFVSNPFQSFAFSFFKIKHSLLTPNMILRKRRGNTRRTEKRKGKETTGSFAFLSLLHVRWEKTGRQLFLVGEKGMNSAVQKKSYNRGVKKIVRRRGKFRVLMHAQALNIGSTFSFFSFT